MESDALTDAESDVSTFDLAESPRGLRKPDTEFIVRKPQHVLSVNILGYPVMLEAI
jgi:hypothetical protein